MRRFFLVTFVLVLAGAFPAHAEETELGSMRVALPVPGWIRTAGDATGIVFRKNLPPLANGRSGGNALMTILAPRTLSGTNFANAFAAFTRLDALADGRPLQTRAGVTVNGHLMLWVQRCCRARNGIYAEAHFIGIESPRGAVFLMLVMVGTRREDTGPLEGEFAAVVRTVRPSPADRVLDFTATGGDAGLEGAWTTLVTGRRPNTFGGMDFFAENEVMLFGRAGVFARAVPPGGQALPAFCGEKPRECGFYRFARGSIVTEKVANDYGMLEREERPLTRSAAELSIGMQRWRPVVPFEAGSRLDGSWRYLFASAVQGAFSSGGVTVERVLTLTPDGRFTRTGFAGFSGSNEAGGARTSVVTGSRRPVATGSYRLQGLQLVLSGDDGRTETLSVFRPDPASDRLLVIDGDNYLRRNATPPAGGPVVRKGTQR